METSQRSEGRTSFPTLPPKSWWTLRDKFKLRWPTTAINPQYLSTALGEMTAKSAAANILPSLRLLGLIDDEDKATELANLWRSDDTYGQACHRMRDLIYPAELLDAVPIEDMNVNAAVNWFMGTAKVGEAAAKKMARVYQLVSEADVAKKPDAATQRRGGSGSKPKATPAATSKQVASPEDQLSKIGQKKEEIAGNFSSEAIRPSLHIDIQIHISAESSEQQIDAIFAGMAKHLYRNE